MGWRAETLKNTVLQKKFKTHYMNNSYIVSMVKMQSVSKNNHLDHLEMTVRSGLEIYFFEILSCRHFYFRYFIQGELFSQNHKFSNKNGKFG